MSETHALPDAIEAVWHDGGELVTATGLVAPSVCALCRALIAAGRDPATPMFVRWPDGRPSLAVRSIGGAARLTVRDNRFGTPVFATWKAPAIGPAGARNAPPMRETEAAAPMTGGAA